MHAGSELLAREAAALIVLFPQVIVEKMLDYLRTSGDEMQKADVAKRIGELAERFAPDTQWFIDTMNQARKRLVIYQPVMGCKHVKCHACIPSCASVTASASVPSCLRVRSAALLLYTQKFMLDLQSQSSITTPMDTL